MTFRGWDDWSNSSGPFVCILLVGCGGTVADGEQRGEKRSMSSALRCTEEPWWQSSCDVPTLPPPVVPAPTPSSEGDLVYIFPGGHLTTTETGVRASIFIRPNVAPTAPVTIRLSSSDDSEGYVEPTEVTFTPENYSTRRVFVHGVDDSLRDGDQPYRIVTAPIVSDDPTFNGFDPLDVSVVNADDESFAYTIVPQPTPPGYTHALGVRIGNSGRILANATNDFGTYRAFIRKSGRLTLVGSVDQASQASDMNESGQVVGSAFFQERSQTEAFSFSRNGLLSLGSLGEGTSLAASINDLGDVVGSGYHGRDYSGSYSFIRHDGTLLELDTAITARDVNNYRQIVGSMTQADGTTTAVLHSCNTTQVLNALPGAFSWATGINDRGQIIGSTRVRVDGSSATRAWFSQGGVAYEIPTGTSFESSASDINSGGEVVGTVSNLDGNFGFLWDGQRARPMLALAKTDQCWQFVSAEGINDRGDIVGTGVHCDTGAYQVVVVTRNPQRFRWATVTRSTSDETALRLGGPRMRRPHF